MVKAKYIFSALFFLFFVVLFFSPSHAFAANRFWVGGTATWDGTAGSKWSTISGGSGGAAVPTAADDVFFNAASGVGTVTTSGTTTDVARSINFTNFTGTFNHANNTTVSVGDASGGSFTAVSGMTYTIGGAGSLLGMVSTTTGNTFTTGSKTMPSITFNGAGGSWQLQDNLTAANATITLTAGTLDANNQNITADTFNASNSNTRTVTMGSGTWTLTGTGTVWTTSISTGLTINPGTSMVVINDTSATGKFFAGGGNIFNNITFTGDNIIITGSNTFTTMNVNNAGLSTGLRLTIGTTQTVTNLTTNGSAGNLAKLSTTTGGSIATLSKPSGTISVDYMSITDITASGGAAWYAGTHSTLSNASGWVNLAPGSTTYSGTVYTDEGTTTMGTGRTVRIRVNGSATATTTTNGSGVWSIGSLTLAGGDVVTIFLDGATEKAATVTMVGSSADVSGLNLYQNDVIVRYEGSQTSIANTNLDQYDDSAGGGAGDTDIPFNVTSGNLTVAASTKLYIWTGKTFTPGGNVTTPALTIIGTFLPEANTLTLTGSGTPFASGGTFNQATSTVVYNSTTATNIRNGTYNNLSFTPAGTVTYTLLSGTTTVGGNLMVGDGTNALTLTAATNNPTFAISGTTTIAAGSTYTTGTGGMTMTGGLVVNGTFSGTVNGTQTSNGSVTGTGTINLTTAGTFELRLGANANFGTTSGSNNWTFNTLTLGRSAGTPTITTQTGGSGTIAIGALFSIGKSGDGAPTTLDAGNRTWIMSRSNASMLVFNASSILSGNTSTFRFTGGANNPTIPPSAGYYNLEIMPASGNAHTFQAGTFTVANNLTIGDGAHNGASGGTNNPTINVGGVLTINNLATFTTGTGTITLSGLGTPIVTSGSGAVSVTTNNTINYTGNGAIINCSVTYSNLSLKPSGSTQQTLCTGSGQTLTVNKTLIIGDGTNTGATAATNNPTINLFGDTTIAAGAVYTKGSGTTTFKAGATQTWTDNTSGQDLGTVTILNNSGSDTTVNISGTASANSITSTGSGIQNLSANGSNTLILTGDGTPLSGNLVFTYSTGTVKLTGTTVNVPLINVYNLTLGGTGTYTMPVVSTNIYGNLVISSNATVVKGGTVSFAVGGGATQTWTDNNSTSQDIGAVKVSANTTNNVGNSTLNLGSSVKATSITVDSSQTFNGGSNTLDLSGTDPITNNGTFNVLSGTVKYSGTTANIFAMTYNNLTMGGAGAYTMSASNTTLRGNLVIANGATVNKSTGTVIFAKGGGGTQTWTDNNTTTQDIGSVEVSANSGTTTLNLGSSVKASSVTIDSSQTFSLSGANILRLTGTGLINNGTFTPSAGMVRALPVNLNIPLVIGGSNVTTFYDFVAPTPGSIIQFKNSQNVGFTNTFTITGSPTSHVFIASDSPGNQWNLNLSGTASVTFASIRDSGCAGGSGSVNLTDSNSNMGNNGTCWGFKIFSSSGGSGGGSGGGSVSSGGGNSGGTGGSSGGTGDGSGGGSVQGGGGNGGGAGASP